MELERLRIDRSPRQARRRRKSRWIGPVVAAVVLGGLLFVLRLPLTRFYQRLTLPEVEIARAVQASPLAASAASGTAANGYIVAARRAALSADTPGRVVEMNVEEGSVVRAGDVVARLYSREYEAAVRRADAELDAARAAVKRSGAELSAARSRLSTLRTNVDAARARLADIRLFVTRSKVDFQRIVDLRERNAATQQEVDNARTQLDRANAAQNREEALLRFATSRVKEGEAEVAVSAAMLDEERAQLVIRGATLAEARATLEKTFVRAPFDGVVVLKDAEIGEVVSPNSQGGSSRGSVVTMVDFASLEVQVDMPERTLSAVRPGASAKIYLDAYPDQRYMGTVKRIWPTANRQKGTVEIRVGFDEPDDRLRPEMGVRVVFPGADEERAEQPESGPADAPVMVPEDCVTRVAGRSGVFLLERDIAQWRSVETGRRRGGRVVIRSGLSGGESVVLRPPPDLEDGARVRVAQ